MRYAWRRDGNEGEIASAARRIGLKLFRTNELGDWVVQFGDRTEIWEVKNGEAAKLTDAQCRLRQAGLKAWIIRTVDDVLEARKRFIRHDPKV